MEARKLVVQVAAVCPFALVLGMGMSFRHPASAHATLQYSDAQNERVEAYSRLMLHTQVANKNPRLIKEISDAWIGESTKTKLQALTPAFQEDSEDENPRSQVIQLWTVLLEGLTRLTRKDVKAHNATATIQDATRVLRLAEILKYSDFETVRMAEASSTRVLSLVGQVKQRTSKQDRIALVFAIDTANHNRRKLPELYRLLKTNYEDFVFRHIGISQQVADDGTSNENGLRDAMDQEIGVSSQQLQRRYVTALDFEVRLRSTGLDALNSLSSAKS
jgi:hypothetical protein